jgi:hypothetical protein
MPQVIFEPMIPAFERAKMAHALDFAATVIDNLRTYRLLINKLRPAFEGSVISRYNAALWDPDTVFALRQLYWQ